MQLGPSPKMRRGESKAHLSNTGSLTGTTIPIVRSRRRVPHHVFFGLVSIPCFTYAVYQEVVSMKKLVIMSVAIAMVSVGGCAAIGKGKGKAPPPASAPIVTKG